jgi:putative ubiquitin-RnfH superfamily antitoxin RatB of RatAB toxin-antitoxin module
MKVLTIALLRATNLREEQLHCAPGTSLGQFLRSQGLEGAADAWGVWGRVRPAEYLLREGDRIELYAPLKADPKDARRAKADRSRQRGRRID